jgi:hypothetical protein
MAEFTEGLLGGQIGERHYECLWQCRVGGPHDVGADRQDGYPREAIGRLIAGVENEFPAREKPQEQFSPGPSAAVRPV